MELLHEWLENTTWRDHPTIEIPSDGKGKGRLGVVYKKECTPEQLAWIKRQYPQGYNDICGLYHLCKIGWASFYGPGQYWVVILPANAPDKPGHWDGFTPSGGPVDSLRPGKVRRLLQRPRIKA